MHKSSTNSKAKKRRITEIGQELIPSEMVQGIMMSTMTSVINQVNLYHPDHLNPGAIFLYGSDEGFQVVSQEILTNDISELEALLSAIILSYADSETRVVLFIVGGIASMPDSESDQARTGFLLRGCTVEGRKFACFMQMNKDEAGRLSVASDEVDVADGIHGEDEMMERVRLRFVTRYYQIRMKKEMGKKEKMN